LSFTKRDFIANNKWTPVHPISIHWIIRFQGNADVSQAATKARTVSELRFKDALWLIWSALLNSQKAADNAVKDFRKRLQACVFANGRHIEHTV